jgi:L-iditol 2-dehydrogenase
MAKAFPAAETRSTTPDNMLVGAIAAPHRVELMSVPIPAPGPGEVLVRIMATAICTYEQRTYSGAQSNTFPWLGGHEIAGEIAALGAGVRDGLAVGDRVAVGSASCGRCHWCLTGQDRACARHYTYSQYGEAAGLAGFAQYKIHPADGAYSVGQAPYQIAALAEPLNCAIHAARMLNVGLGEDAVVIGAGVMGLLNVVALKKRGARVIVSEMDERRLATARAMGADELINVAIEDPVARVKELTESRGASVVIAAVGGGKANEQAMGMLAERGRFLIFAGAHPETPLELRPNGMHNREQMVSGAVSGDKQDFYTASRLIRYGQVDLSPLVQATYPLTRLADALDEAIKPGAYRVIVAPWPSHPGDSSGLEDPTQSGGAL